MFLTLVLWAVILLLVLYFAQLIIGLALWILFGVIWLVALPFTWLYKKYQVNKYGGNE